MPEWERMIFLGYLLNLLKTAGNQIKLVKMIVDTLEDRDWILGDEQTAFDKLIDLLQENSDRARVIKGLSTKELKLFSRQLCEIITRQQSNLRKATESQIERNLRLLAEHLHFDQVEMAFVGLLVRHMEHSCLNTLLNDLTREHLQIEDACAFCLGVTPEAMAEYLRPDNKLLSSGLICRSKRNGTDLDDHYTIQNKVRYALVRNQGAFSSLLSLVLGEPIVATLSWDDFAHLGETLNCLEKFLYQAVKERMVGVNILVWGVPGTGKTELCKTLAAYMGLKLYAVMEKDDNDGEPTRKERLDCYQLSQNILSTQNDSLLMFDEMDDLFVGREVAALFGKKPALGSKVFINRLLENNPVPTLWLINDVTLLDHAFIRRMSLALEIKPPPATTREQLWQNVLQKNQVHLAKDELKRMVDLNISPAVVNTAASFASKVGGSADDLRFAAQGIIKAMNGGRSVSSLAHGQKFNLDLTNADVDLGFLTDRLCRSQSRAFSLCLYGPSGTGKSAYLRYLAEQLGMPIVFKRASDLLDKHIGESEKSIAAAFQEAIDRDALLIFDEADSLLGDRRDALHSWEISQVNEMLTWMEYHPLPFACTTNLREHLDPASLRRFTFKCKFDYLEAQQAGRAYSSFLGHELRMPAKQLLSLLTPGDFVVVKRKAEILGLLDDTDALTELLLEEVDKRGCGNGRKIGFSLNDNVQ